MAEVWIVAVYFAAMVVFIILAMWLYWRTSDDYKLKKKRRDLGYRDDGVSVWQVCFALCVGPINRKRWESKHKYFKTESYGPADSKWMVIGHPNDPNQGWQNLPRGDVAFVKGITSKAVAKVIIRVLEEEYNSGLNHAIHEWQSKMSKKKREEAVNHLKEKTMHRSKEAMIEIAEKQNKRESMWEMEETKAEEQHSVVPISSPFDKIRKTEIARKQRASKQNIAPVVLAPLAAPVALKAKPRVKRAGSLSHVLDVQQLRAVVNSMDEDSLEGEHLSLPLNVTSPKEYPQNRMAFNRNDNMAPNKHTRVSLECPKNVDFPTDYINANFVRGENGKIGKYIVTQAPMSGHENGKKNTRDHFWTMVWNYQVPTIVMLMRPTAAHCPFYWPTGKRHKFVNFGPFTVTFIGREESTGIVRTELGLSCEGSATELVVNHFMYKGWPTTGVPQGSSGILTLLQKISKLHRGPEPIIVHDEFGDGAAGVFVAADQCITHLKRSGRVDILKTVATLREDRGGVVKELEHYQFLHKLLAVYSVTNKVGRSQGQAAPPKYNAPPKFRRNTEEKKFDHIMEHGKESETPSLNHPESHRTTLL
eukprot:m.25259 g.25259  ORF g.25259 m.25259 type:complete len:590 (-) comp5742_c0_seq1:114-1883(-)